MKRKKLITLLLIQLISVGAFTQNRINGQNNDPYSEGKGARPYEMEGRKETHKPILTFDDCSKWTVEATGCTANLYRSNDQLLYRDYVGKLRYEATAKSSEIIVRPEKPIEFEKDWDCMQIWHYGAAWNWVREEERQAFRVFALIEDGNGEEHTINFVQKGNNRLVHKYWFLNRIKLTEDFPLPLKFTGIKFVGREVTGEKPLSIYLGPIYAYKEELKPLTFEPYPEKLPFPLREETILPINKTEDFTINSSLKETHAEFTYSGDDVTLLYRISKGAKFPFDVKLLHDNKEVDLFYESEIAFDKDQQAKWIIQKQSLENDTLHIQALAQLDKKEIPFHFYYTINKKSLVIGMEELADEGNVSWVKLGKIGPVKEAKLFRIPFLNFDYKKAPNLLYTDGLFYFMQFDWYYTDASTFYSDYPEIVDDYAIHNGGVKYIAKTDGKRNPLHEKLFINVSPDVHEVFPTIDNPKSPMRSAQANRLWRINGNPDHDELKAEAKKLRSLGIENLTIRYHEGIWRDGGESYTFRLETAPGRGGSAAVKELVDYIKSKDWRVGLYTNYTDYAPVNANWNEDWVQQGPKGEWQVSWARCFAPKPMKSLEAQRKFAPKIHAQFGTNHSYCDVHTAITPMSRVDYDYRVPGAGTFRRTFECYGQILLNEKKAYNGPVYSEGGNHWWYAGLVDGNYANAYPSLKEQPIFPDFHLLKIHPLEMDAGNVYVKGSEYLAYTLAHGNIGICDGEETEMMKRYYMLQPLQEHYSMIPVRTILYEQNGNFYETSEALKEGYNKKARLKVEYESGCITYVNFEEKPWLIEDKCRKVSLPQFGVYVVANNGKTWALSGNLLAEDKSSAVDIMQSPEMFYLDTKGSEANTEILSGKGQIALKKEKFGWEIIPARDFETFSFQLSAIDIDATNIRIVGVDEDDLPVNEVKFEMLDGRINLQHKNKEVWKYRIIPAM